MRKMTFEELELNIAEIVGAEKSDEVMYQIESYLDYLFDRYGVETILND